MNSDSQQVFSCEHGEYRVYCKICDKLCIELFHKISLKSQTQTNTVRKENNYVNHFK